MIKFKIPVGMQSKTPIYSMANYIPRETGQPFKLWLDSAGKSRNNSHGGMRVKAEANNVEVDVGFDKHGEFTTWGTDPRDLKAFKEMSKLTKYMINMKPAIQLHWDGEITDTDFGAIAKQVSKGKSVEDAITEVLAEYEE
jgi:hypothetical protein